MSTAKRWCFTLNNPDDCGITSDDVLSWDHRYIVFQREVGESGTPHFQGSIFFDKTKRLAGLKKICKFAHWEPMRGNADQAIAYCTKEDTRTAGPWEDGDRPVSRQGHRSDLENFSDSVKHGDSVNDLWDTHTSVMIRYTRGAQEAINHYAARNCPTKRDIEVYIYWGKTATGKTTRVYDQHPDCYSLDNYPWFDGYNGQDVLLMDDFYGNVPISVMLKMLGGFPFRVQVKGSTVLAKWTKVYITSNTDPDTWYKNVPSEVLAAFKRRITDIIYFE